MEDMFNDKAAIKFKHNLSACSKDNIQNRLRSYYLDAGFTIEAVFIVPIVFYIVLLFILMNFYLRDYNIMISKADHLMEKYRETDTDDLIKEDYILTYLNNELWFSKADNINVNAGSMKLSLKADLILNMPRTGIFTLFSLLGFEDTYQKELWLLDRTETARIFTVGINTLGRIKGVNDIIDRFLNKQD